MILFGEWTSTEITTLIGAFLSAPMLIALGAGAKWLADQYWKRREANRTEHVQDEDKIITHYKEFVARVDKEYADLRAEVVRLRITLTRCVAHIRKLEGIMEGKGQPVEEFDIEIDMLGSSPNLQKPKP